MRCGPDRSDAGETDVDRLVALARTALGAHQPILPVFKLATGAELAASASDRAALLGGDETAPVTWLHRAGLVRAELEPLCGLLTHAEAAGANAVADLAVAQLPHRPGARWCELPFGAEGPPPAGTVGVVAHAPGGFDPTRPLAGLFVDAWAEVIPSAEHTAGVAFHYDAPGARPPQAILLAVHPDLEPGALEPAVPARDGAGDDQPRPLRTVTLRELDGMAGVIPALYLPNNYTRDVASVSFTDWSPRRRPPGWASSPPGSEASHDRSRPSDRLLRKAMTNERSDLGPADRRAGRGAGQPALGRHLVAPGTAGR